MPRIVIGDYEFDTNHVLGSGNFGAVYKGRTKNDHNRAVAVKRIPKNQLNAIEISILQDLSEINHGNTVRMFKCMRSDEFVYVVMELCNGGSLADYLEANNNCLPVSTIRIFLRQIAAGMECLVLRGICHRDLKPQNLLLSHTAPKNYPDPKKITLKIADFGLARVIDPGVKAGSCCGTIIYMAPEVLLDRPYDHKSDLWGIGTIVYECLTGRMPFMANTLLELMGLYSSSKELTFSLPANVNPSLKDLLLRLLKKNPDERIEFEQFFKHSFLTGVDSHASSGHSDSDLTREFCVSKLKSLIGSLSLMTSSVKITAERLQLQSDTSLYAFSLTYIRAKLEKISSRFTSLIKKLKQRQLDPKIVAPKLEIVTPKLIRIALVLCQRTPEVSDLNVIISQLKKIASEFK